MDGDDDVVMVDAGPPVSSTGTVFPAATDSAHGAEGEHVPSLMETFQEKVIAPGKLIEEVEAHQKSLGARKGGDTSSSNGEVVAAGAIEYDSEEEGSNWGEDAENGVEESKLLPRASLPTGLCYDIRMRYHCEVRPTADVHPEDPRRIYYIYKELCKAGLVDDKMSSRPLVDQPLLRIPARDATEEEISLVHDEAHYAFVKSTQYMDDEALIALEATRDSIYFNKLTFVSSILSCGGAIETCKAVASGKVKNAIAVIRPPGHHAEHDKTMGFCLFNNVSVAAKVCQREYGDMCRKILILDWDVHHGNGIQKAFYDDPNVLYISLHVYRDGRFYPGGDEGNWDKCGEGNGLGKNINIPWPAQGMGDGDYLYAFQEVIMPIAYEFDPDLVIVASGFDAAAGDELGGCFVTPPCYAHMTRMLMNLAQGKVAVCLEGGYNFRSISKSALAVTRTLMGEPPDRLRAPAASKQAVDTVRKVAMIQAAYWQCMYPKGPPETFWGNRVHDIIRAYQAKQLYDEYKLTSLYIYHETISKSFEHQVLATPNYDQPNPLLVIFHDPPELMGIPHPVTGILEPHNTWLADEVKGYIGWAVENGFGVIDVNMPKHISESLGRLPQYESEDSNRAKEADRLAVYLWENYIEPNEATEIFFMGVGDAFAGLANLLINKDRVYNRISGVVSFVSENPLRAIASTTQTWLSKWYKENSLVFVSDQHTVFDTGPNARKPSKRYGNLKPVKERTLNEMVLKHREEVWQWMQERCVSDQDETESE
ncbi:hypothetical protein VTO42DRAFT_561 [Malbranchea cinnamomea]